MIETIPAALGSIQAALEISKTIAGAAVDSKVREKQSEVTGKLIEAQSYILQMQADHAAALRRADEAEAKLVELENTLSDLERYEPVEVSPKHFALRVKPGMEKAEIPHYACPYCAQKGIKSVMTYRVTRNGYDIHICPKCNHRVADLVEPDETAA